MPSASPSPLIDLQGEQSPQQPSLVWCACMVEFQSGPGKQPSPAITGFVGGLVRGKGPDGVADLCLSLLSADFCLILPFSVSFQTFSIIYLQEFTHARTHTHTHTHTHIHTHHTGNHLPNQFHRILLVFVGKELLRQCQSNYPQHFIFEIILHPGYPLPAKTCLGYSLQMCNYQRLLRVGKIFGVLPVLGQVSAKILPALRFTWHFEGLVTMVQTFKGDTWPTNLLRVRVPWLAFLKPDAVM